MGRKKYMFLFSFILCSSSTLKAQRLLTEARLFYSVLAEAETGNKNISDAFANSSQTIWLRGNMARVDFSSPLRQQSTIYNAITGGAVMLRESGTDKYRWDLDSSQWISINQKWDGASYKETGETREIAGYLGKKVIATLKDSSSVSIYITPQLVTLAKGYDLLFSPLDGLPIQYDLRIDGIKITFILQSVQTGPIGASRFDIPEGGYKIMEPPK